MTDSGLPTGRRPRVFRHQALSSATARVFAGVGTSAVSQGLLAAQAILLVPFFLRAWGPDGYGSWLTLVAAASYLSLLDLGGQIFFANLLTMHHARGDVAEFRQTLSEGVSLFVALGLGAFGILLVILFGLTSVPLPGGLAPVAPEDARVLALVAATTLLLAIPGGVYATVYRASGLFARGAMVGNAVKAIGLAVSIVLLYVGVGAESYAAVLLGVSLLSMLAIAWDSRRCIPGCRGIRIGLGLALAASAHLRGAVYFWFIAVAQSLSQQGVVLVLAATTSQGIVVLYATHRTLASLAGYISVLVQGPVWPELTSLWAQGRQADLHRATMVVLRTVMLATGVMALCVWIVAPLIYPIWTGRSLDIQPLLLGLLLFQGVLSAGWMTTTWTLLAANHHRSIALWSLANAGVTISLAAWLAPTYGPFGVVFGSLVGDLVCGIVVFPRLAASFLGQPSGRVYLALATALLILIPLAAASIWTSSVLNPWWALAILGLATVGGAYPLARASMRLAEGNKPESIVA